MSIQKQQQHKQHAIHLEKLYWTVVHLFLFGVIFLGVGLIAIGIDVKTNALAIASFVIQHSGATNRANPDFRNQVWEITYVGASIPILILFFMLFQRGRHYADQLEQMSDERLGIHKIEHEVEIMYKSWLYDSITHVLPLLTILWSMGMTTLGVIVWMNPDGTSDLGSAILTGVITAILVFVFGPLGTLGCGHFFAEMGARMKRKDIINQIGDIEEAKRKGSPKP